MRALRLFSGLVRTTSLFTSIVAATGLGCGLISFDTTVNIAPEVIPAGASADAAAPSTVASIDFAMDSKNLPSNADLAQSATLKTLTLKVTAPANGTFDFLSALSLTITAAPPSKLPAKTIASGSPTPGAREVILRPVGDVDLLPYVYAGALVHVTGIGRPPSVDTTVAGQAVLTVSL